MPGPPSRLETFIGFFIPPVCREQVLGDLHERYQTTPWYVVEAICTVPRVIESRIRRTTDAQVLLMEACVCYMSFLAATWKLDPRLFVNESWWLLRLWVPVAAALLTLMLWDAWTDPKQRPLVRPFLEASLGMMIGVLASSSLLPRPVVLAGGGMAALLLATLRMMFPPNPRHLRGAG